MWGVSPGFGGSSSLSASLRCLSAEAKAVTEVYDSVRGVHVPEVCADPDYPLFLMLGERQTQCHLACFSHAAMPVFVLVRVGLTSLMFDGGGSVVPGAMLAGFLDLVGVVPGALDDAGIGAFAALVQVPGAGDLGDGAFERALPVRGEKPGRRPGGG
jgi:hypothetical protein